jgi:hypothetical protein
MKKLLPQSLLLLLIILSTGLRAQDSTEKLMDRTVFSIMVRPYSANDTNIVRRIEQDPGYKDALSAINSTLIDMGYTRSMDPATYLQNARERNDFTHGKAGPTSEISQLIQKAPVDIFIDTEITWIDPPGNPRNRQVKLLLKAVDKYTGAIYAVNSAIASYQRAFPDLSSAVEHCLKGEGKLEFQKFLDQLDNSYARVMKEGRMVNMRFETGVTSSLKLTDRIGNERLSDRIEACVRRNAFKHKYKLNGINEDYLEFIAWVPAVDETGVSVSPYLYMGKKVDDDFQEAKLTVDIVVKGSWINFILQQRQ